MKNFVVFFSCFLSLLLVAAASEAQARSNGVYIVYTGAAVSSSAGFVDPSHILSPESMKRWENRVIHRYSSGFSGFAARLSEEEAEVIAQRPDVVSVFPDTVLQLHTTRSWDFLREMSGPVGTKPRINPKPSSSLSDQDVIIGILDTGIWPEAKSFNDKDMSPVPKKWKGKCISGPDFKCNRKLIGARNYVHKSTSSRDHNGHGTHVAGIAAGRLVPNASYNGLARGTAQGGSPGSRIAVYRVCSDQGCSGSAVLRAFDDAIADGVDIISISFGSINFNDYTRDPIAVGAFHAAEAGILVVASAGEALFGTENPWVRSVVPWILTVDASTIDRLFESDVVLGGNKVIKARGIHSTNFQKTPVYPLIDAFSAKTSGSQDYAARNCYPGALDASKVKGKIVVCETEFSDAAFGEGGRSEVVGKLGGIGVIAISYNGYVDSVYSSSNLVVIAPEYKDQILSYINSTRKPVATILPTVTIANYKPAPSLASSLYYKQQKTANYSTSELLLFPEAFQRSPVESAGKSQPDVVAPGIDILSAWPSNTTDTAFNIMSGASMACPHVTAIAASVKALYPSWSPSAIKSAIMTTASQTNNMKAPIKYRFGGEISILGFGAGEVTVSGPLQPGLVYESQTADYLRFLCNKGYDASRIKLITTKLPPAFSCPSDSGESLVPDLNYPWIVARGDGQAVRTMTNVGEEEQTVYLASVEIDDKNVKVEVSPRKLAFTRTKKKQSYLVRYSLYNYSVDAYTVYGTGSITWSNGKHRVRIPVNLYFPLRP